MKHIIMKLLLLIAAMTTSLDCRAEKLFEALASNPHVESVYVGKAMMGMARDFLSKNNDKDTTFALNAIKDINSIEIISCENAAAIKDVKAQAQKIIAKLKLEVILETKETDESTIIYGRTPSGKDSAVSDIILETSEPSEYTLIHINGRINFQELIKQQ